jgi:drug/metabolite transporter (DMT)-like permease
MSRLHADIALLFAAAIWGLAFVFQKSAMSHVGPLTFLAARSTVAALALAPLAMRESAPRRGTSGLGFLPDRRRRRRFLHCGAGCSRPASSRRPSPTPAS